MAFGPFIEAPIVRTQSVPTGGIDTEQIDKFRQGIEIRTEKHRTIGVMVRLSTTRNLNHQIELNLLGENSIFVSDGLPFADKNKFDPVKVIQYGNATTFSDGDGPFGMDGVIEPLVIRDEVTFDSIESPFIAHSIKGNLQGGNEDQNLRSEQLTQFVDLRIPSIQVPFLDSDEYMGNTNAGSIRIPGIFSDKVALMHPFNDAMSGTLFSGAPDDERITNNSSINDALRLMTGSYDQDFRPLNHKSSTAGFVYNNNTPGTDSIAFGGLRKS